MRRNIYILFSLFISILACTENSKPPVTENRPTDNQTYSIQCEYLKNPDTVFPLVKKTADFWKKSYDATHGGFYTFVQNDGTPVSGDTNKTILSQSRVAFAFAKAYLLTGEPTFLQYSRYATNFISKTFQDTKNGGFYTCVSETGTPVDFSVNYDPKVTRKWSFMQHYALLGVAAAFEAGRYPDDFTMLLKGRKTIDEKLWDNTPGIEGYYETADYDWSSPRGKGFTPTLDGITTHVLSLYLLTGKEEYKKRLIQLADNIVDKMLPAGATRKFGFPQFFNTDWQPTEESFQFIGHMLKTAWCLGRVYMIHPRAEYLNQAEAIVAEVIQKAWSPEAGAPYSTGDNMRGSVNKGSIDWWTTEQAITGGLVLYHITGNKKYLQMADSATEFFTRFIFDHEHGGAFGAVTVSGNPTPPNQLKGNYWKSGYHTVETLWFIYVYGNLFLHKKPVTLHYNIALSAEKQEIHCMPVEIEDGTLKIASVVFNGKPFSDFDGANMLLRIPAHTEGTATVVFEPVQ